MARNNLADYRPMRLRLRPGQTRGPRRRDGHDVPYRGGADGVDARGDAMGLGQLSGISRQPRSPGAGFEYRLAGAVLAAALLRDGSEGIARAHADHRRRDGGDQAAVSRRDG